GSSVAFSSKERMACREANTPSPIAVPDEIVRLGMEWAAAWWSWVGDATTVATEEKATKPTLNRGGKDSMKLCADSLAEVSRSGATSVAAIDGETSIATRMVARSRGTWTSMAGRASARIKTIMVSRNSAAGTWRRHADACGTTC